ncbi:MAG: hypothetical protein WC069_04890 [Candidatus Shapirobacteria bacterium]
MSHGGCCNCFICKLGKSLGLMEECKKGKNCCQSVSTKTVKKKVVKKATKSKAKSKKK